MTILAYILSLALSFCLNSVSEADTIRTIQYVYIDAPEDENGIDYYIKEVLTFADADGNITTRETLFDFPYLIDSQYRDWQFSVNLLANERGVTIKSFDDNVANGVIDEGRLDAFKDASDGFVSDFDSFDYLDERELQEQQTRYVAVFVNFGLFYMSAGALNKIFAYWLKPKKREKGV